MKKLLKNLGILLFTGASAVGGFILSTIVIDPESITVNKDANSKNEKESE